MPRPNEAVANLLYEYADLIQITGGQAYKARAYEKAARSVATYGEDLSSLDAKGLQAIPNVGASIAEKIIEYQQTGRMAVLEQLRKKMPGGVRELTAIPTLGPRKAAQLHDDLGISSVDQLVAAIEAGQLDDLKGFGPKTSENIMRGIEMLRSGGGRVLISTAMGVADEIVTSLAELPQCEKIAYAGSLRRMRDSIGDVDILAASADAEPVMAAFVALPIVAEVIARGPTKTSIRTRRGLQVDLRVVPAESWGAALQYFTGSKDHNIRLREIAIRHGLKLSEYGLFRVEGGELVVSRTEEEVYQQLDLPWIPPVLREDRGEIAAGQRGELPRLVTEQDLRGDLHTHTDLTDGVSPLLKMVEAAHRKGYRYYAVTDHAPNLFMQRMTNEKMLAQREQLASPEIKAAAGRMVLLHGTELNIDAVGEVDWDADFLRGFDICVASVHSHFRQPMPEMTRRLIAACENPYVNIIGHPSTRQIGRRAPVDADWDAVFEAAAATGTAMEINSFPDRLDLGDDLILRAKRHGVKFAIDSDSHYTKHLDVMVYGIGMAQRAWLTPDDIINTWPLSKLRAFVAAKRPAEGRPATKRPAAKQTAATPTGAKQPADS